MAHRFERLEDAPELLYGYWWGLGTSRLDKRASRTAVQA